MFCCYCGKQIKDNVAFCPHCGKEVHNAKFTNSPKRQPHKKRRFIKFILLIIVVICAAIAYKILFIQDSTNVEYAGVPVNGNYVPNENNIIYTDDENSFGYVNNMILIFFKKNVTQEEISEVVHSIDGNIVGQITGINQVQVEVSATTKSELEDICSNLSNCSSVKYAVIDYVISTGLDETFIPNDPWKDTFQGLWGIDWNEDVPDGLNWWIEATHVLSAWGYDNYFSTINIGVVDNGFDSQHDDLSITILNNDVNNPEDHGTHVSGIIGATINNNIGISGILNHVNLYGVDCYATSKQKKSNISVSSLMNGIVSCLDEKCQVINMSSGKKYTKSKDTQLAAEESAKLATKYLIAMLDFYDNDFIIIQAAGNGNRAGVGVDTEKYGGYFSSINESVIQAVFTEFEEDNIVLEHNISTQDIMDSFMVVGAVDKTQKNGQYQLTDFSNYGSNITVTAPGAEIFSTVVSGGLNGSYGSLSGTSMAAPIVTGITAMVWSVDPTMTSSKVKEIIIDTAQEIVQSRNKKDSNIYYMINAKAAVEKAIDHLASLDEWTVTPDSLIYVYDEDGKLTSNYQVSVSFVDLDNMPQGPNLSAPLKDTVVYSVTNPEPFELSLSAGIYQVTISQEDYTDQYVYYALVSQNGDCEHFVYTNFESVSPTQEEILDQIIQKNYYDHNGNLIYYDSYAYYDNGLLCSTTLHSVDYMPNGSSYIGAEYTFLYLYDENWNLTGTVLDALTISEWYNESTGEIILDYEYDANGNSSKVCIYPKTESIEQEKFGVDASKTEVVYGIAPIITTDLSDGWATAYLNEIFAGEEPTDMTSCRLIYVDNNSIPELLIDYGYGYAGAEVYTQSNDGTDSIYISQGVAEWIENENLLLTSGGHMDVYYDEVYKIEDGKFVLLGAGDYGAKDNSNVQYDEQGNPIYDYYWNDSALSKDEYEQNLNNLFNGTRATNICQNIYTYDQCKLLLLSLSSNATVSTSEESVTKPEQSAPSAIMALHFVQPPF